MDNLVIGGIVLSIVISLAVYYFLNKKLKREIENIKHSLELDNKEKVIEDVKVSNNYENLKNQYDDYVETNNFDDLDEIPDNIKTEIDNLDKESKEVLESKVEEATQLYDNHQEENSLENLQEEIHDKVNIDENVHVEEIEKDVDEIDEEVDEIEEEVHENLNVNEEIQEVEIQEVEIQDGVNEVIDNGEIKELNEFENYDSKTEVMNIDLNKSNSYSEYSFEDLNNLTLKELQDIARNNKIKVKGRKDEVLERVKSLYNLNNNLK